MKKVTGLKVTTQFEDINTYDIDTVVVDGYNRKEIAENIERLLTKNGIEMYGKLHKWRKI